MNGDPFRDQLSLSVPLCLGESPSSGFLFLQSVKDEALNLWDGEGFAVVAREELGSLGAVGDGLRSWVHFQFGSQGEHGPRGDVDLISGEVLEYSIEGREKHPIAADLLLDLID